MAKKDYRIIDIVKKVGKELRRKKKKRVWSSDIFELAMKHGAKDIFEALSIMSIFVEKGSRLWHSRVINLEKRVKKLEIERGGR